MILMLYLTEEPEDNIGHDLYEDDGMSSRPSSVSNSEPASKDKEQLEKFGLPQGSHDYTSMFFLMRL
jgi:hypothetical protein